MDRKTCIYIQNIGLIAFQAYKKLISI